MVTRAFAPDGYRRGIAGVGAPPIQVPTLLAGPAVLVAAAFFDTPERELLWIVAAVMDLSGPVLVGPPVGA